MFCIGDMHQPLHWLREHDYGKDIKVVYKDEWYTLLSFWEDFLPTKLGVVPVAEALAAEFRKDSKDWHYNSPPELFREWAHEVAEKVCVGVYQKMEINHADGTRTIDKNFHVTDELFEQWVKLAQELTHIAGLRLAFILTEILQHRRHSHAHELGRGIAAHRVHLRTRWAHNLGYNVAIGLVVVPGLLLMFWLHFNGILSFCQMRNAKKDIV